MNTKQNKIYKCQCEKIDEVPMCECNITNEACVKCIKENMLKEEEVLKLADLFKVFGDGTRLKIIYALLKKELCVCDISKVVGMSQSSISHQLRVLKAARLVKFRKEGKVVYYSLDDDHVDSIFRTGLTHIEHK